MIEQIKEKITGAFRYFKEKDGIEINNVRIKIVKNNGRLNYFLLNGVKKVRETDMVEMIKLNFLENLVVDLKDVELKIYNSMKEIIEENKLNENSASVVMYPAQNYSPCAYLYNNGKPLKQIDIEKLIN